MIFKQKAFQKLAQIMKLRKTTKKMPHPGIEPELCEKQKLGVHGADTVQRRYLSATLPSISEVL